ncbi:diguanylate cyclase [Pseudomonas sp. W5-01]|uniref:diguanylate cyclase n=1 Tax=Pseudomonas sp. W5-01 TaxID=3097454 RepID=UPI003979EE9B
MTSKTGSFAKRLYLPRALGSAVGFWAVAAVLYTLPTPAWIWGLLAFQGFVWPHLAFLLARRSAIPYIVERRNLLVESAFGGLWVAAMHFNLLPTTLLISMLCMNSIAVGGPLLLRLSLASLTTAVLAFTGLLNPGFAPETTPLQVYACIPMLAVYPLAVGGAAYHLSAKLAAHKRAFREHSRTDMQTGLLNQSAWRSILDEEYELAKRGLARSAVALIDLDHFKAINDGYGHLAGDAVIKLFSEVLAKVKGPTDTAGRIGGDEFGLIIRGSNIQQIRATLARLQQHLQQTFSERLDVPAVSLSIGFAEFSVHDDSAENWLRAADLALYEAKGQGRNQIAAAYA